MWSDTIVDETRKAREEYAAKFNFDLEAIYCDLKEKEEKSGREVVTLSPRASVLITATQGRRR